MKSDTMIFGLLGGLVALFASPVVADTWKPVVIFEQGGQAPDGVKAPVIEAASLAVQQGSLEGLARSLYGSGPAFKNRKSRGLLSAVGTSFQAIDRKLAAGLAPLFKSGAIGKSNWDFTANFAWTQKNDLPALRDKFLPQSYALLWMMGEGVFRDYFAVAGGQAFADAFVSATQSSVLSMEENAELANSVFMEGRQVHAWLSANREDEWLPMFARTMISVRNGAVILDFDIMLKPGAISMTVADDKAAVSAQELVYKPEFSGENLSVAHVQLMRRYTPAGLDPIKSNVTFGYMPTDDVRSLAFCLQRCENFIDRVPTIRMQLTPNRVASTGVLGRAASAATSLAKKYNRLSLMLKRLTFDLSDPAGPRVVPETSEMPVVVVTKDVFGNEYTKVLDAGRGAVGINVYERAGIAEQAAGGLTAQLRADLAALDKQSNGVVVGAMGPFAEMFRQ